MRQTSSIPAPAPDAAATPAPRPAAAAQPSAVRDVLVPAIGATLATLLLTGLLYPVVMTGIARVLFPERSQGSLVEDASGNVVGSALLAQGFTRAVYFQPRPSAAGDRGWDPTSSGGSNLGPTSRALREAGARRLEALLRDNPDAGGPPPVELVTASASGLDPHLSPAAARWQAPRVAKARGVSLERVQALVDEYTEGRDLGVLGEPRVNVLQLNLAIDRRFGAPGPLPAPAGEAAAPPAK